MEEFETRSRRIEFILGSYFKTSGTAYKSRTQINILFIMILQNCQLLIWFTSALPGLRYRA